MGRETTTIFRCDVCNKKVKGGSDLRRFALHRIGRKPVATGHADLCDVCESQLLAAVEPYLGDTEYLRREEP